MNLQTLQRVQTQTEDIKEHRSEQASNCILKGLDFLNFARDNQFKNADDLQDAVSAFLQAIQIDRSNPIPLLTLGHVFYILEELETSLQYIEEALKLEPDDELALEFKQLVQESFAIRRDKRMSRKSVKKELDISLEFELPQTSEAFDELYDKVEHLIQDYMKVLMTSFSPTLALNSDAIDELKMRMAKIQQEKLQFEQYIAVIDQEIDTHDLRALLHPVDTILKRSEQLILVSVNVSNLSKQLNQELQVINQVILETIELNDSTELSILEENLEVILENYDSYKQSFQELRAYHQFLGAIRTKLKVLNTVIERFQEELDNAHERLIGG